ncbi:MAG: ribosome recycling factor [Eubacteriales bacterium]|nr:ribosome recycling factor [Clostridiales bacterium]MDD6372871.1 ribosome recycling factor [Eubacteriales bacterium]MDD7259178.1 ribosome recycling factor [Eubacteriales bacterium]MDY6067751.1 ribosome recycling factor [Candidatus Faecousia sp.]
MSVDFTEFSRKMDRTLEHLGEDFDAVRAGRANAKVLDRISVEYYGSETPLNGVATISSPDARTLVITPWDTKLLKEIQKAIQMSDLGINPQNDGRVIRLIFPQLTEERRKDLSKQVKKYAEDAKVAMRNIRRDGMDYVKKLKKNNEITEDDQKKAEKDLQDMLDKYIKKVDAALAAKDKELMSI